MTKEKRMFKALKSRYIGDKDFYKSVLSIAVPIMIQNGITNIVSMLDNIMVGRLNTEAMSGVSIVNQFLFIFYLLIFGAISGAGIFTSQYFGSGDNEGIRYTVRFKVIIILIASVIGISLFAIFDEEIIGLFLHESESSGDLALTLEYGKKYLAVSLIGLVPFAFANVYASTMRETGEVLIPMISSLAAVATNFALNIILIFGLLGFPALGVVGAAIATVISRFVECFILVIYAHTHKERFPFIASLYSSLLMPKGLFKRITLKGVPLMLNEFFWAMAMTLRNQCYSTRGLDVVAAQNISSTVFNVFSVVYMALGSSVAIIVGKILGSGDIERAKDTDRKMIALSIFSGLAMTAFMVVASLFFPKIYNTTDTAKALASYMMIVSGITMPFNAFANASYFTLRSGGKVLITMLFDSVYMWVIVMPVSIAFAYFTSVNIFVLFAICQGVDTLKTIFGAALLKRGTWANVLVGKGERAESEQ